MIRNNLPLYETGVMLMIKSYVGMMVKTPHTFLIVIFITIFVDVKMFIFDIAEAVRIRTVRQTQTQFSLMIIRILPKGCYLGLK